MICCTLRRRQCCARVAGVLLAHVNLLLVVFSGAGLATAARLAWDPSAYVVAREALPAEYRLARALLPLWALALLALAHAATHALALPPHSAARRPLLFLYAALMTALVAGEAGTVAWAAHRVLQFLQSPAAARLRELLQVRDHLRAALDILARFFPLPDRINEIINEAMKDLPRNGYAAEGAAIALGALQAAAVTLALLAAAPPRAHPPPLASPRTSVCTLASVASAAAARPRNDTLRNNIKYHSDSGKPVEERPLRTVYRNGRLVVL